LILGGLGERGAFFKLRLQEAKEMKFLVLGGDMRNAYLFKLMAEEGLDAQLAGFSLKEGIGENSISDMKTALSGADIVIGPIPFSNGQVVNAPFSDAGLTIGELFASVRKGAVVMGGRLNTDSLRLAKENGAMAIDILDREEMAMLNAIPTAEGAIQTAMENTPFTIHQSKVLVTGFGRISKVLAKMLQGLGADVHVAARKPGDLALIEACGYAAAPISSLEKVIPEMNVIVNTVPAVILDKNLVSLIRKDALVIELASKPFGIDAQASRDAGVNVIFAPSLPGKVAPLTAARYIFLAVKNILQELEK
jgi:dipicolinate synthase subunit A